MEVNLNGPFYFSQAVVPDMIEAGWGRIVNISSSSAPVRAAVHGPLRDLQGRPDRLHQGPGTRARAQGITVNTIPPGFVDTPMLRGSEERGLLGGSVEDTAKRTPVRRAGTPEDIAHACSFLVSDGASYVTGQVIGVNGGRNT